MQDEVYNRNKKYWSDQIKFGKRIYNTIFQSGIENQPAIICTKIYM